MPTTQVRPATGGDYSTGPPRCLDHGPAAIRDFRDQDAAQTAIDRQLPIVQQFQVLGVVMVACLVLAAILVYIDNRTSSQGAAAGSTATEMQMLSQRLSRGTALASQGQTSASPS